jgi:hypothetical protein
LAVYACQAFLCVYAVVTVLSSSHGECDRAAAQFTVSLLHAFANAPVILFLAFRLRDARDRWGLKRELKLAALLALAALAPSILFLDDVLARSSLALARNALLHALAVLVPLLQVRAALIAARDADAETGAPTLEALWAEDATRAALVDLAVAGLAPDDLVFWADATRLRAALRADAADARACAAAIAAKFLVPGAPAAAPISWAQRQQLLAASPPPPPLEAVDAALAAARERLQSDLLPALARARAHSAPRM